MNTFNKKSLCVALAAAGMLGAAGVAQAVNVSADGLGKVLIYPYYTVNKRPQRQLLQHADVRGQHDEQHESGQGPLPRRQEQRGSSGLQRVPVAVRRVDRVDYAGSESSTRPEAQGGAQITTSDKSCTIPSFYSGGVAQQVAFRTLHARVGG